MKTKFCFYSQRNYPLPRTAIETESLFPKSTQQALGVKLTGPVQKPWHLVINGYEIPINPMNPNWKYFR